MRTRQKLGFATAAAVVAAVKATNDTAYYMDGAVGVDTSTMYWKLQCELHFDGADNYCFEEQKIIMPELTNQQILKDAYHITVPAGLESDINDCSTNKLSTEKCHSLCLSWNHSIYAKCPLNLLGCCQCHYFEPKVPPESKSSMLLPVPTTVGWGIIPGWFNLGVWCLLALMLLPLVFIRGFMSSKSAFGSRQQRLVQLWVRIMRVIALVGLLMFALWLLVYLIGLNGLGYYQTFYGFFGTRGGLFTHVFGGMVWLFAAVCQFIGPIRRRYPLVHRVSGYVCIIFEVISSLGLIALLYSPHMSGVTGTITGSIFLTYWNVCLFLGTKFAIERDIDSHKRWMTRNVFVGSSVVFQRIFNIGYDRFFQDEVFYMGNFYTGLCPQNGLESVVVTTRKLRNEPSQVYGFSQEQISYACNGITALYSAGSAGFVFMFIFVVVGLFGCELWLWANGLQAHQISRVNVTILDAPKGPLNIQTEVQKVSIELVEKSMVAQGVYRLRFKLPQRNMGLGQDAVLVPVLGHVNLSSIDTKWMHRPRPFSPLYAIEEGHISFLIRDAERNGLSSYLTQKLNIGQSVAMSGPFAVPAADYCLQNKVLVIAAGTGLAPFLTMARSFDASNAQALKIIYRDREKRALNLASLIGPTTTNLSTTAGTKESLGDDVVAQQAIVLDGDAEVQKPAATEDNVSFSSKPENASHPVHVDAVTNYENKPHEQHPAAPGSLTYETHFARQEFNDAITKALENETYDVVLICGPPAFNFAMQKRIQPFSCKLPKLKVTCIGTDDR